MQVNGFVEYTSRTCEWVMRMAYLNILWLLFSVLGLGIFGVIPATIAVFAIQRKWLQEEEDIPIFFTFWHQYKTNFVSSNKLGIILILIGWIIYFDLKFFVSKPELVFQLISFAIFTLSIWYMIVLLYIFPVFVHYELKLLDNIKIAFYLGILNPSRTIGVAACGGGIAFLVLYFPKLLPFFGVSLPCFVLMLFASQGFLKVEKAKMRKEVKLQNSIRTPKKILAE